MGITENPITVGMAVKRHAQTGLLELRIEQRKNVPNAKVKQMKESTKPKNKSLIPNIFWNVCLLNEYVVRIMCTVAYVKNDNKKTETRDIEREMLI